MRDSSLIYKATFSAWPARFRKLFRASTSQACRPEMPVHPPKSWSSTLRLPKSSFPFRASSQDRAVYLQRCTDDLYTWQTQHRKGSAPFILHDGPPYANGSLHIGHALNKILKDIICRTELHQGRRIQFVPGWDCHGLPIEIKALEKYRKENEGGATLDAIGIRRAARNLATKTVREQKKDFRQWAVMGDWENAWTTKDKTFEMKQLRVFQEMVKRDIIFRRYKPVYWSPSSRTALAEAELEYKDDHESTAAYIKFPIIEMPQSLREQVVDEGRLYAVIWTTTPWTLPANRAIAINPDLDYNVIQVGKEQLLVAASRLPDLIEVLHLDESKINIVAHVNGARLDGATYRNILRGPESTPQPVVLADFVSADSGTGLVHCAPGHGMEDYEVCLKQGIAAFAPVDDAGCFTDAAFPENPMALAGLPVLEGGSAKVIELLGDMVVSVHKYKHKYPYDWRTKLPVIVRATEQWFADVGSIKEAALASLADVEFIPNSGKSRLESFVKGRSEWCISRQRAWGVPIPALYDETGAAVLTDESVAHIISTIGEKGSDAWWTDAEDDCTWVAPGLQGSYRRGKDTMDVWFDSGSSWTQTEGQADVYCEGTDQHRGWFQSSLLTYLSASGRTDAPFRKLITHGFTLDQDGKKMSKSIGNVISPNEIIEGQRLPRIKKGASGAEALDNLGPDVLRLWVASSFYQNDVLVGEQVLKTVHASLVKYRTTIKMLLGSMHAKAHLLPLTTLDKIALCQLDKTMVGVWESWQTYDYHRAVSHINRWINSDLSAFYLEGAKDRLYCGDGGSVLYHILHGFLQMLAPVTPILVEEAWEHRPEWYKRDQSAPYPFHRILNPKSPLGIDQSFYSDIEDDIPWLLNANMAIKRAQEDARTKKLMTSSLQSSVVLALPDQARDVFEKYKDDLEAVFVVSSVALEDTAGSSLLDTEWKFSTEFDVPGGKGTAWVLPPKEAKCPRCWRYVAPVEDHLCARCENIIGERENVAKEETLKENPISRSPLS